MCGHPSCFPLGPLGNVLTPLVFGPAGAMTSKVLLVQGGLYLGYVGAIQDLAALVDLVDAIAV